VGLVELFMEFGADLDIPDANGTTGRSIFVHMGPTITAAITKWFRKRSGEQKPLDGKTCANCRHWEDRWPAQDMQQVSCSKVLLARVPGNGLASSQEDVHAV